MTPGSKPLLAALALAGLAPPAEAKVVTISGSGFIVSSKGEVRAIPQAIWAQLIHPERWWNKAHSWSGNAANFRLSAKPGGCFCETLAKGGFVEHARVIHAAPARLLRLSGALGPLQGEALVGTLTVTITPGTDGTSTVAFDYDVGGYSALPLADIAPAVDGVLAEQHGRLLKLLAEGRPE